MRFCFHSPTLQELMGVSLQPLTQVGSIISGNAKVCKFSTTKAGAIFKISRIVALPTSQCEIAPLPAAEMAYNTLMGHLMALNRPQQLSCF